MNAKKTRNRSANYGAHYEGIIQAWNDNKNGCLKPIKSYTSLHEKGISNAISELVRKEEMPTMAEVKALVDTNYTIRKARSRVNVGSNDKKEEPFLKCDISTFSDEELIREMARRNRDSFINYLFEDFFLLGNDIPTDAEGFIELWFDRECGRDACSREYAIHFLIELIKQCGLTGTLTETNEYSV